MALVTRRPKVGLEEEPRRPEEPGTHSPASMSKRTSHERECHPPAVRI